MNILIIDDERTFTSIDWRTTYADTVCYARNLEEAEYLLFSRRWHVVYLDHDLGNGEETRTLIKDVEWKAYNGILLSVDKFVIHTMNTVGRRELYEALHKFYNVEFARVEDLV